MTDEQQFLERVNLEELANAASTHYFADSPAIERLGGGSSIILDTLSKCMRRVEAVSTNNNSILLMYHMATGKKVSFTKSNGTDLERFPGSTFANLWLIPYSYGKYTVYEGDEVLFSRDMSSIDAASTRMLLLLKASEPENMQELWESNFQNRTMTWSQVCEDISEGELSLEFDEYHHSATYGTVYSLMKRGNQDTVIATFSGNRVHEWNREDDNPLSVLGYILRRKLICKYSLGDDIPMPGDNYTSRFSGTAWYKEVQNKVVTLAGIGGIGSFTAFMLSRLHVLNLVMYDMDSVDESNLSGQMYGTDSIGRRKTEAMSDIMNTFSAFRNVLALERFTEESEASDIMICGFDNMAARKLFFDKWKKHVSRKRTLKEKNACLFIDGRLSISELQVYALRGDDGYSIEKYERDCLFGDSESEAVVCSLKQTTFMANMIGSIIANLFVNYCGDLKCPNEMYMVPFFTYYDSRLMYFKTED